MSRAWKALPTHLPGWHGYSGRKPRRKKANKARKIRRERGRATRRPQLQRIPSPKPFAPSHSKRLLKILQVSSPTISCACLFERKHGHWRCIQAPPPLDWFTRVNHPDILRAWLIKNHYEFSWLSVPLPQASASVQSPVPSTRSASAPLVPQRKGLLHKYPRAWVINQSRTAPRRSIRVRIGSRAEWLNHILAA